ncbi:hypothetical protein R0137_11110 [Congregibacter brevis]|uniref:Uncharacterized protein n=1 Tax=Congregibacter brevis TaxID=3081201 RepID=A0ABZ0ICM6_9GAMM|nr:hypothetical protein R0137_11110 [Congregibacter sp. IMCC45268]
MICTRNEESLNYARRIEELIGRTEKLIHIASKTDNESELEALLEGASSTAFTAQQLTEDLINNLTRDVAKAAESTRKNND